MLVIDKLAQAFERWLNGAKVPDYLKQAIIVPLSKTATEHPARGDVRPIAILPAVAKLYETVILHKLQTELQLLNRPLHTR